LNFSNLGCLAVGERNQDGDWYAPKVVGSCGCQRLGARWPSCRFGRPSPADHQVGPEQGFACQQASTSTDEDVVDSRGGSGCAPGGRLEERPHQIQTRQIMLTDRYWLRDFWPPLLLDDKVRYRLEKGVGRRISDLMHTFKYRAKLGSKTNCPSIDPCKSPAVSRRSNHAVVELIR
jgi:hypothetical protein